MPRWRAVLNSRTLSGAVAVAADPAEVSADLAKALGSRPIAALAKEHGGALHIFAVRMEASPARATFRLERPGAKTTVTVLGENRTIELAEDGTFADDFGPHAVHLYRIPRADG